MKKNIFNTDQFLFAMGGILFFLFSISLVFSFDTYYDIEIYNRDGSTSYMDSHGRSLEEIAKENNVEISQVKKTGFPYIRLFFLFNGAVLIGLGFYYRNLENKIISIWNLIESSGEVRIDHLMSTLGLPKEFIIKHLGKINLNSKDQYIYDPKTDKIFDSKLLTEFSFSTNCKNCGYTVSKTVPLSLSSPISCPYCATHISSSEFNELKSKFLNSEQNLVVRSAEFNIWIFSILAISFWPLAIAYYFFISIQQVKESIESVVDKKNLKTEKKG